MYALKIDDKLVADGRCVVAISLGNTPLRSADNTRDILLRLQQQYQDIVILICDDIHKYEQMIPRTMTPQRAQKKAVSIGDEIAGDIYNTVQRLEGQSELSADVSIVRWNEIEDRGYQTLLDIFQEYRPRFEEELRSTSEFYIQRRLKVATLTNARVESFTQYTLAELPVQLMGLTYNGAQYKTIFHPVFPQGDIEALQGGQEPHYVSPIEDVVQAYKNDEEVMGKIKRGVPSMKPGTVARVFFRPLDAKA